MKRIDCFFKISLVNPCMKKGLILYHIFDFCWGIAITQHSTRTNLSVFIIFFYSQSSKVSESASGGFSDVVSFRFLSPFQPPILRRQVSFFLKTISHVYHLNTIDIVPWKQCHLLTIKKKRCSTIFWICSTKKYWKTMI